MRVAVEATSAAPGGGLSFLRGGLGALDELGDFEFDVFVQPGLAHERFGSNIRTRVSGPFRGLGHRLAWVQLAFPRLAADYDAIFAPGNIAPLPSSAKTVLFVQNAHVVPQAAWREEYGSTRRRLQRLMARLSMHRAARTVFISRTLKTWARPYWSGRFPEPAVAHPGVTLRIRQTRTTSVSGDVLLVGNLVPHKRIGRAIRAFSVLTRLAANVGGLRIAGSESGRDCIRRLTECAAREGVAERVKFLGFLGGDDLARAYSGSSCYLSTSALEAFPLPPLEAMAAGTPVVVPDTPVFQEVCGDAGIYSPDDATETARRLATAIDDRGRADYLRRVAQERASMFSWQSFADTLSAELAKAAHPRSSWSGGASSRASGQ